MDAIRQLAEEIAADLFTNGNGDRAGRLVLTIDGPPRRDLGGWGQKAMADRIEDKLREKMAVCPER